MIDHIRNFCIIAHIDHGKSTLADRFLEVTETVSKREMRDQLLDQMDLERERGITIKLQPVRMLYRGYEMNLIDTPGHVDFTYEVSRSLAAVEGCVLLVDATQGVEAQTLSHLYLALEQNLAIVPVVNKIDLPNADPERVVHEVMKLLGVGKEEVLLASGKTGTGVREILDVVIEKIPAPSTDASPDLRALIFDSKFDEYRGVVAYVRVVGGEVRRGDRVRLLGTHAHAEVLDVGYFHPALVSSDSLATGSIGYIITNVKTIKQCRVGDTIVSEKSQSLEPLPGYRSLQSMVFASIFPQEGDAYPRLREALEKLQLNDAALVFEPEHSPALGHGFRCGTLGVLHLDIVQERLHREYNIDLVVTAPSVAYRIFLNEAGAASYLHRVKVAVAPQFITISSPHDLPEPTHIDHIEEPWIRTRSVSPSDHVGNLMQLFNDVGGEYKTTEYLDEGRVVLEYLMPLASLLADFYDKMKTVSSGYASLSYDMETYRQCDVERLDIVIADERIDALSTMVYVKDRYRIARKIVETLKDTVPRQLFEVKIQASVGGAVIASERTSPLRKDVTAKLSGGDVTRKRKLLDKQKKGKKRMMHHGKVTLPPEAFRAVLKR